MNDETILNDDAQAAMVSKIEALFRKAADPAATEHESAAFHAKALALMAKYRIAHVNTDVRADERPTQHLFARVPGSYAPAQHMVVEAVARAYGCRTFYESSGRAGDPARTIYIFGFGADAQRVKNLSELFILDAKTKAARHKTNDPNTTIRWRKSFLAGYASEVIRRFQEAQRLLDQEETTETARTGALVLVARAEQVDREYGKIRLRPGRAPALGSPAGFAAGQEAGRNSTVGRSSVGGSGRALGAG